MSIPKASASKTKADLERMRGEHEAMSKKYAEMEVFVKHAVR